jgi:hypothetical protein
MGRTLLELAIFIARFPTARTPVPGCTQIQYSSVLLQRNILHFDVKVVQEIALPRAHKLRGTIDSRATPSGVWFGRSNGAWLSWQRP